MAFNDIIDGDEILATPIMQNFRHVNYGNHLLPVDSDGDGVDATINWGSASFRFLNAFLSGNLEIGGYIKMANNPTFIAYREYSYGTSNVLMPFTDATVFAEVGGDWFDEATSDNKFYPPTHGLYKIKFAIRRTSGSINYNIRVNRYNSAGSLIERTTSVEGDSETTLIEHVFKMDAGDYFTIAQARSAATTNTHEYRLEIYMLYGL
jgi:hypothetical protein